MRLLLALLLLVLVGCEKYEFDVVRPEELAAHVPEKGVVLDRPPIKYEMWTVENRLVIHVVNETDQPIDLVGEQSFLVDPYGQSRPMRGQGIGPRSFARLVLPPLGPVYRAGPTWGFGVGVGYSDWHGHHHHGFGGFGYDWVDGPAYLTVVDDGTGYFWEWRGETSVRLKLTFRREKELFAHDWLIQRVKKK
jgi:hypothetical protein